MSALNAWITRIGLDPENVKRKALAGGVIGLAVVAAQKMIGFGS